MRNYRELVVWQKAMVLTEVIYRSVKKLPREEMYSLGDQMRRAAVSVPSNIAEGQARNSTKEFVQFLSIARGSVAELETQLTLCERFAYLSHEESNEAIGLCDEISKMLTALISTLSTK